ARNAESVRGHRQLVRAVREREVERARPCPRAQRLQARAELARLAERRPAAVVADHGRRHAVRLDQLQRLRVVARGDLHFVAVLLEQAHQRPEDERVRARGEVDPDLHRPGSPARTCSSGASRRTPSTWRSYQSVNASTPQSWRDRSSRPATCRSSRRVTASGRRTPWRRSVAGASVSRANGSRSPRSHAAAGIENPRLRPCTTSRGSSCSTALRSSRFFCSPRTFAPRGSENEKFATTGSMYGTRASSDHAIEARSVFTSR